MRRAFTLVEILIVVVILGILAAIVTPQFSMASSQANETATLEQLTRIRRALAVYYVRSQSTYPAVSEGEGTWGELSSQGYFKMGAPSNGIVGGEVGRRVILRETPDSSWHQDYGWIYNPRTGDVWAACFDTNDKMLPRIP